MKGEEGVKTTGTTTLEAPKDVPAIDYVAADADEEIKGNGSDSFAEKETSQDEENGDADLEGLSLDDGLFEVEAIHRKRYRKVSYCFIIWFLLCVLEYHDVFLV